MKRSILAGILVLAAGVSCLMAQGKKGKKEDQQQQQQQQQQPQLVPNTKSPGESQAVVALVQANGNPDAIIKAAEELVTKYADTFYKEMALVMEAQAYQQKGDRDKATIINERVLEVNPKNFQATLSLGEALAQGTRENDLDKEEKLTKATKYLTDTIENLKVAPKPNPQVTDQQWEDGKKAITAEAHNGLGLVALVRKKYDVAITEFTTASDMDPEPAYRVRLASAYQNAGQNKEAIDICEKLLADTNLHPQIRQVAQAIRAAASQVKK
jgi:tetratricopeptide (TPR) repeat protein